MNEPHTIFLGKSNLGKNDEGEGAGTESANTERGRAETLALEYANRHGLISGATGTGKTVTLQILAEGFSRAGVPVFLADVKGDLAGLAKPSKMQDFLIKRANTIGLEDYEPDVVSGHVLGPVRQIGPSNSHDDYRDGPNPLVQSAGTERNAGRCPDHCV